MPVSSPYAKILHSFSILGEMAQIYEVCTKFKFSSNLEIGLNWEDITAIFVIN